MKETKTKKKKGCLITLIAIIVIIIILIIVSSSSSAKPDVVVGKPSNSQTQAENSSNTTKTDDAPVATKTARDNSGAKQTTLSTGTYTVGKDIPAGRYIMTPEGGSGNLIVTSSGDPIVNEVLGNADGMGVPSVTATLSNNDKIEIDNIANVKFTPAPTKLSTTLTTGTWVVGLDIKPGRYKITPTQGSGNFIVTNSGDPVVNEVLGKADGMGVPNVTATLENGEVINISGMDGAKFVQA